MKQLTINVEDFLTTDLEVEEFGQGSPKVLITGGVHGGEATGIYTAQMIAEYLRENPPIQGTVKVIPICNPTAFRRMERTSPYDNLDMNRIFPGDANGSITMRTANKIWEEAQDTDYLVDLHCCGNWGYSYTLALWQDYDYAQELTKMLDIPIAVQSAGAPGQLFVELSKLGKKAVIIELPGGGPIGEIDLDAGDEAYDAVINMLAQLNMIDKEAYEATPQLCEKLIPIKALEEGLFLTDNIAGDILDKGDIIGEINGEEINVEVLGTLTSLRPPGFVFKGDYIGAIAPHIKGE
jgi:predicted deacylase